MPQTFAPERPPMEGETRSLTGLFSDLWRESLDLFREEAELAKAEITEKVSQVQSGVVEIAAGALVLYAGFLVLLAAASVGLVMMLPEPHGAWLGPLIVGVIVMIAGAILLGKGRSNMKATNLRPERTMQEVRRDVEFAKEHAR